MSTKSYKANDFYPHDWEYYKKRLNCVNWIQCEVNKAKDYTLTLLAKIGVRKSDRQ